MLIFGFIFRHKLIEIKSKAEHKSPPGRVDYELGS